MRDMAKWILRGVIVVFGAGFLYVYVSRNGWTIAQMPMVWDGRAPAVSDSPTAAPAEPSAPAPVATAAPPTAPAPAPAAKAPQPAAAATPAFPQCQPIGRTEKGELVYSMDCRRLPAP
ncbi:pyruvate/2-oxoglutarate dehydrogenase complex dihydrolipoamide acyltransferase (E2) component [Rhodopseudomonas rhenobacensis]|uniref:Pyruvate/2-oxoglutarate dehydrogenase complex dihydrolipoamide acyltransferase (E2) component n=1 Tax=Rhodopseudomonas rhenobacensis TaxID=87461 RepID=A0A7W8DYX1_9BRAD|nr:hypothetical protein [Rhodopseudomonas rhenobacensis]MBB5046326.1 pyruvate/2-oxoglutarate dehydrogenase complex dihydrolipoamide acyltransferase (E2) component [Rhodopseudomonas rhenobacensis]